MPSRRAAILLALSPALLAALRAVAQTGKPVQVVASFSILADMVASVGGERAAVSALVGPGGDAHVYTPTPGDARALASADLVVVNGLGFEGWMERLIRASGTAATLVTASSAVSPRVRDRGGENTGGRDPHAWQSVANARLYAAAIRDGLIAADPQGRNSYEQRATEYDAKLVALDQEIRTEIAKIAPERRKVMTTHDAFGYFADAYGIAFVAPQGLSGDADVSARTLGRIVTQIRAMKIPAVFMENLSDRRLVERLAQDGGARIGGTLYADALTGPGGPAPTYIDMMRHNVRQLVEALAG